MDKKYEICTYNTFTKRMEKVAVSKEIYEMHQKTDWKIKNNNKTFYKHEIQMSSLIGGQNGAYENFKELVTYKDTPYCVLDKSERRKIGLEALNCLTKTEYKRYILHYYEKLTIERIADIEGVSSNAIKVSIKNARKKLKKFLQTHYPKIDFLTLYK